MAKEIVTEKTIKEISRAVPHFIKLPVDRMWIDYDKQADVLYISFRRPQKATDSEMLKNGILLRYKGERLVGMTILEASKNVNCIPDSFWISIVMVSYDSRD
jgi:uncharacterized protein YuzE